MTSSNPPLETPAELRGRLLEIARSPILLVACDYDGTLSPIVDDPTAALPHRESIAALRSLAAYPDTHVAVVSGRSLRDLAALSRLPAEIHLVGSHGSEFDAGFAEALDADTVALRTIVTTALDEIALSDPGFGIEKKPASVAFHYRGVDDVVAARAVEAILAGPAAVEGVRVKHGKMVIELAVIDTNKGTALDRLRRQVAADAVVFVGDDVTDEDAFAALHGPDLAIKVGEGDTCAHARLDDTEAVAHALALLCELRRAWLEGEHAPPIEEHSLLSDQRTVALVTPDARVTWMCHPRADSPAVFAELVGGPQAGHFSVRPDASGPPISQRYLPGSLVLETRWSSLMVTDYLDVSRNGAARPPGPTELIRVLEGRGVAHIDFAPRLDFGRAPTRIEVTETGLAVRGVPRDIALHAPDVTWTIVDEGPNQTAHGTAVLDGHPVVLELAFEHGHELSIGTELERRQQTVDHWRSWAARLRLPSLEPEAIERSALTLKALCHQPTGAMLAAATTSLPEVPGGIRNWDYRYCWPRDSALSACALVALGSTDEARALLEWIHDRIEHLPGPEHLRPLYPLSGDEFLPEAVLPTLNGYLGSRPVRIGNAADQQVQLDVFGPVVELVFRLAQIDGDTDDATWQLVHDMVAAVSRRWHEPDHGIWEERRPQRHHVHSKVMCWLAIDRAIATGHLAGRHVPASWPVLRHTIAGDVVSNGWNDEVGAYTIAYGDPELDASVLWIGLSGLLPTTDPRFVATVKAIEKDLRKGAIVYRYRLDDGLPGDEGGFLICTAWLIEAYVLMGQLDDARTLFDRYLDLAGHTGLLSEEFDPVSGLMLGNHPQAYSHLGLVNAAIAIDRAHSRG